MWGLFQWGEVSALLKMGLLRTRMEKRNRTIWVYPSQYAYDNYIKPLLALSIPELEVLAGWRKQHPLDHQATLASLN